VQHYLQRQGPPPNTPSCRASKGAPQTTFLADARERDGQLPVPAPMRAWLPPAQRAGLALRRNRSRGGARPMCAAQGAHRDHARLRAAAAQQGPRAQAGAGCAARGQQRAEGSVGRVAAAERGRQRHAVRQRNSGQRGPGRAAGRATAPGAVRGVGERTHRCHLAGRSGGAVRAAGGFSPAHARTGRHRKRADRRQRAERRRAAGFRRGFANGLGGPMPLQGALPGAPHGALVPAQCGRSPWRGRASSLTGAWA